MCAECQKLYISLYLCRHSGVKDALNASVLIYEALIYWLHIKVVRFCPLVKALTLWSRVRIYVDRWSQLRGRGDRG